MSRVRQFVMAYSAEHDEIKALLPEGFSSLRPVLRINLEQIDGSCSRVEFNTPVEHDGIRGWLNMITWETGEAPDREKQGEYIREEAKIEIEEFASFDGRKAFRTDVTISNDTMQETILTIIHTLAGVTGGCPAENDNQGTFNLYGTDGTATFREVEIADGFKEYSDCEFFWNVPDREIKVSQFDSDKNMLIRQAMYIEPIEVLGAYVVDFER